jgi:hypothetical protein
MVAEPIASAVVRNNLAIIAMPFDLVMSILPEVMVTPAENSFHLKFVHFWWQNSWHSVLRNVPNEVTYLRTAVRIYTRITLVAGG